jgi:hypothetical protein
MIDDDSLNTTIKLAIYNLMLILYDYGIEEIHMGGLMRILGVKNSVAKKHDNELVVLDKEFAKYVKELTRSVDSTGQTLH